ncbi:MAG TPA: kynureninase [Steroidobacteraceae bacterium]|nr:kynureninase [Steroidobacteraceae bacterium]
MMSAPTDRSFADRLDAEDPLRALRSEFQLPLDKSGNAKLYFCGHSLGLQPLRAKQLVVEELDAWARQGVDAHFESTRPWVSYHERLTPMLATLTGAHQSEVVAMNSLTVNLQLLLTTFYRPTRERYKILIEHGAFPSDRYAVASQLQMHGFDPAKSLLEIAPHEGESHVRMADMEALIEREGDSIALVLLPGVQYLTGQCFDMEHCTRIAQRRGCYVGLDLAHAIGNVPLALHDWNADFAVWCSYKYLNGGPGAIGGAFIHERHERTQLPRLAGWWGHDKDSRFSMPQHFAALPGAEGWQLSNPPILAMAPLLASLELFERASMPALRTKSLRLTGYLMQLLQARLQGRMTLLTPTEDDAHGAQVSLRLNSVEIGASLRQRLSEAAIVCDWRGADLLRVAPVPSYNTFVEVWKLIDALVEMTA